MAEVFSLEEIPFVDTDHFLTNISGSTDRLVKYLKLDSHCRKDQFYLNKKNLLGLRSCVSGHT